MGQNHKCILLSIPCECKLFLPFFLTGIEKYMFVKSMTAYHVTEAILSILTKIPHLTGRYGKDTTTYGPQSSSSFHLVSAGARPVNWRYDEDYLFCILWILKDGPNLHYLSFLGYDIVFYFLPRPKSYSFRAISPQAKVPMKGLH